MHLLICVSGGIAAYKACEIVSLACRAGHEVRVAMTVNATRFVTPLTFQALSGEPVLSDLFSPASGGGIDHITWAKWAEVAVIAPATANLLGKLAHGLADDALTSILMALPAATPVVIAPAMNTQMWLNPILQRNVAALRGEPRFHLVEPVSKRLACGDEGPGGMAAPADVLAAAHALVAG